MDVLLSSFTLSHSSNLWLHIQLLEGKKIILKSYPQCKVVQRLNYPLNILFWMKLAGHQVGFSYIIPVLRYEYIYHFYIIHGFTSHLSIFKECIYLSCEFHEIKARCLLFPHHQIQEGLLSLRGNQS